MPVIPQTLSINNSRTARAKSINLHTIRKLIEYSLENLPLKAMLLIDKIIKKYLNHKFSSNKNWLKDSSDVYYFKLSYIGNLSHKY